MDWEEWCIVAGVACGCFLTVSLGVCVLVVAWRAYTVCVL
jgi:hypothetical protein